MVAPEKGERLWNLQFWGLEFLILHLLILFTSFRGWMKSWLSNCTLKVPEAWVMAQQIF